MARRRDQRGNPDPEPPPDLQQIADETIPVLLQYRRDDVWRAAYARLILATQAYTVRVLTKAYGPATVQKNLEDFNQGFSLELIEKKIQGYRKEAGKYASWVAQCAKNYFSDKFLRPEKRSGDERDEKGWKLPPPKRMPKPRVHSLDMEVDTKGKTPLSAFEVPAAPVRKIDNEMARRLFEGLRDVGKISLEHRVVFMLLENIPLSDPDELATFERLCRRKYEDIRLNLDWNPPKPKFLSSVTGIKPNTLAVIRKRVAEQLRSSLGNGAESADDPMSP